MPRIKLNLPGTGTPWTKIPNVLLDQLMPKLRDTELRLLLVLLRQTAGWNRDGRPVVLSYRTLSRRTGRQSEALSRGIDSLLDCKLILSNRREAQRPSRFPKATVSETEGQQ